MRKPKLPSKKNFNNSKLKNAYRLDATDIKILNAYQSDPYVTLEELTTITGIRRQSVRLRTNNLYEYNFIRDVVMVNRKKVGFTCEYFINIKLRSTLEHDIENFEALVNANPNILESFMVMGEYDYILKVISRSIDSMNDFVITPLSEYHNVKLLTLTSVARTAKREITLPLCDFPLDYDNKIRGRQKIDD
jgi:DNA-binding Lrp family transcriptional regulator